MGAKTVCSPHLFRWQSQWRWQWRERESERTRERKRKQNCMVHQKVAPHMGVSQNSGSLQVGGSFWFPFKAIQKSSPPAAFRWILRPSMPAQHGPWPCSFLRIWRRRRRNSTWTMGKHRISRVSMTLKKWVMTEMTPLFWVISRCSRGHGNSR